jgi:hypothetical protein
MKPFCSFCLSSEHPTGECGLVKGESGPLARRTGRGEQVLKADEAQGTLESSGELTAKAGGRSDSPSLSDLARALGKRRWEGKSKAERMAHGKMMAEARAAKERGD